MPYTVPNLRIANQWSQGFIMIAWRRGGRGRVVELPVASAVEEALPLVAVEDQDPLVRVARDPQQDPLGRSFRRGRAGGGSGRGGGSRGEGGRRGGGRAAGERDLDCAVARA